MNCEYCDGDGGAYHETHEGVSVHYNIRSGYSDYCGNKLSPDDMTWEICGGTGESDEL